MGRLPPGTLEALRKWTGLGVNPLGRDIASPMYEFMTVGKPNCTATADIFHVEGQVRKDIYVSR